MHAEIRGTDAERALIVLAEWVGDGTPSVATIREALGERDGTYAYSELKNRRLIEHETSLGAEAMLTPRGRDLARYILSLRGRGGPERNDAVRRGVLLYLADNPGTSSLDEFLATQPSAYGAPFSQEEVDEAAGWLRERDLIKAFGTSQASYLRPSLTPAGRGALVASIGSTVDDYLRTRANRVGVTHQRVTNAPITNYGTIASAQIGDHNSATVHQHITADARQIVLAKLAELEVMPEVQANTALAAHVSAIRSEVEKPDSKKDGVLAKVALAFGTAAATAVGTPAGQKIFELLGQIPQMLGG